MTGAHRPPFRTDIEGLRGLAVLLVVSFHAFDFPTGGYVGVDVFFVLSGFLITGILVDELEARGRISISGFYVRRVRRILPAALVVLGATVVVSGVVWFLPRASSVWLDAVASLFFVENVRLIAVGSDYLQAGLASSPLQHFWSLAVEEQFYALWPLLLAAVVPVLGRRLSERRAVVLSAATTVVVAMSWAVVSSGTRPAASYYDPAVRAWELGAGALLAALMPALVRVPAWLREAGFVLGLMLVLAAAFLLDDGAAFPWPMAVVPVLGTTLVLATGDRAVAAAPLRWRAVRHVGRTSYSLYLWHLPVLVAAAAVSGESAAVALVAVIVSWVLAVLTERFVERPFRAGRRGVHHGRRVLELPSRARRREVRRGRTITQLALGSAVSAALVVAAGAQWAGPLKLRKPAALAEALSSDDGRRDGVERDGAAIPPGRLVADVVAGVEHPAAVGSVRPGLDLPAAQTFVPAMVAGGCRNDLTPEAIADPDTCSWGDPDAARTAVVIGDSIALSWTPAIVAALDEGWRVEAMGFAACPMVWTPGQTSVAEHHAERCAAARTVMEQFVQDRQPELVLTASSEGAFTNTRDGDVPRATRWRDGATAGYGRIATPGRSVVVLGAPPEGVSVDACANRFRGVDGCVSERTDASVAKDSAERAAVDELAQRGHRIRMVSVGEWFCTAGGLCPVTIDDVLVRSDAAHLTGLMSGRLGLVMRDALAADLR